VIRHVARRLVCLVRPQNAMVGFGRPLHVSGSIAVAWRRERLYHTAARGGVTRTVYPRYPSVSRLAVAVELLRAMGNCLGVTTI
jgi:hypothetical protein